MIARLVRPNRTANCCSLIVRFTRVASSCQVSKCARYESTNTPSMSKIMPIAASMIFMAGMIGKVRAFPRGGFGLRSRLQAIENAAHCRRIGRGSVGLAACRDDDTLKTRQGRRAVVGHLEQEMNGLSRFGVVGDPDARNQ